MPKGRSVAVAVAIALASVGGAAAAKAAQEKPASEVTSSESAEQGSNGLDCAALASLTDDQVEREIAQLEDKITLRVAYDDRDRVLASLPAGMRALYVTSIVEGEVKDGGFNQYYWNIGDAYSVRAVEAFEFFGAKERVGLIREANAIRAREAPLMAKYKARGTIEAFSESYRESRLRPVDLRYWALKEDLTALRVKKIREMPDLFCDH